MASKYEATLEEEICAVSKAAGCLNNSRPLSELQLTGCVMICAAH